MDNQPNIPFFFILGRPRTGTTLIRSLFDAHPNVQIPWECQFILNLYPKYGKLKHWDTETLEHFYAELLKQWQFSAWNIDKDKLLSDLLACEGEVSYARICQVVYLNNISLYPKGNIQLLGDKNPGYSIYIQRLKEIYPDAKFIYISRDYRDNYHSIIDVDFELHIVSLVVYKWKYFYRKALEASKTYPDSIYFIRYEDLVSEPELHMKQVCSFLNLPYDPGVFDFYKFKDKAREKYPVKVIDHHHKSLFNPVNTSRIGLWEKSLSKVQIRVADLVAGKYAEKAGYVRKYPGFNLGIWLLALPGVSYARFLYVMTFIIDLAPYRFREKVLSKGPLYIAKAFALVLRKKPKS